MAKDRKNKGKKKARRKAYEASMRRATRIARAWELFGEAMRFTSAHVVPGADVLNAMRFGRNEDGTVLEHFARIAPGLTADDRELIAYFQHTFSSVFYVDRREDSMLELTDMVTGRALQVGVPMVSLIEGVQEDRFAATVVVPTPGAWFLGGLARPVRPSTSPETVLRVANRLARLEAPRVRAANPGITRAMLDDLFQAFNRHFEADHFIGPPHRMQQALAEFHAAWQPPEHEGYVNAGSVEADFDVQNAGSVAVIADPDWGHAVVENLEQLLTAVRTRDSERVARWWADGSHPAAFRCAHRNFPDELDRVLQPLHGADFRWSERGEGLLARAKPQHYPPRPSVLPLPRPVAEVRPWEGPQPADGIGLAELLAPT